MTKENNPNNDFDFEELHQQVSKLMDKATKKKRIIKPKPEVAASSNPKPQPKEEPEQIKVQKTQPVAPEPKPQAQATPEAKKSEDAATPVVVRRVTAARVSPPKRGMAMDVLQAPNRSVIAPPSARASRTAATIQPTGPVKQDPPSPRTVSSPEISKREEVSRDTLATFNLDEDAPVKPAIPKPPASTHPEPPKAEPGTEPAFPDPLDVHGFTDDDEKSNSPVKQQLTHSAAAIQPTPALDAEDDPLLRDDEPAVAPKNIWEMPSAEKAAEPQAATEEPAPKPPTMAAETSTSPFVNAKVTKRPLGAFADETPKPSIEPNKTPHSSTEAKEAPPKAEINTVAEPPKEFNPEIVAVESEEPEFSPNNLRQMAIPPQYHTEEKEPSHDDRPMFDTKNYHTPLQPVALPRHSGGSKAGVVFTIILILLLIAAGVLAYFVATGAIELPKTL